MEKLKKRWGVDSNWQVIVIMVVFSVTGYVSLIIAKPVLDLVGLSQDTTNPWLYRPLRIVLICPIYQTLIVFFGWLFGQFNFFWNFEKKMIRRLGLGFLLK